MSDLNQLKKQVTETSEIEKKVREIIIKVHNAQVKPDDLEDNLSDLDSVQTVELVVALENAFGVMINNDEMIAKNYESVSKIVELISSKLGDIV